MEAFINSKPCVSFQFEVEKVLGISSEGTYQVQWAPAWVSKFHLVGCEHLIQEFLQEQQQQQQPEQQQQQQQQQRQRQQQQHLEIHIKEEPNENVMEVPDEGIGKDYYVTDLQQQEESDPKSEPELQTNLLETLGVLSGMEAVNPDSNQTPLQLSVSTMKGIRKKNRIKERVFDPRSFEAAETETTLRENCDLNQTQSFPSMVISDTSHEPNTPIIYEQSHSQEDSQKRTSHKTHSLKRGLGEKSFPCQYCEKVFNCNGDFIRHARVHTGTRPYSCHVCGYSCKQKGNLVRHIRTHTGEKPCVCEGCGKRFKQPCGLNYHRKRCAAILKT